MAFGRCSGSENDVQVDGFADFDIGRQADFFDQNFLLVVVVVIDREDVNLDALSLGLKGLFESVSAILVAVGNQHDPASGIFRKAAHGQLEGTGEIGVIGVERTFDAKKSNFGRGRWDFDSCIF